MIFSALFAHYTHLIAPVDIFVVGEYVNTTRRDGSQPPTPVTGVKGDPTRTRLGAGFTHPAWEQGLKMETKAHHWGPVYTSIYISICKVYVQVYIHVYVYYHVSTIQSSASISDCDASHGTSVSSGSAVFIMIYGRIMTLVPGE